MLRCQRAEVIGYVRGIFDETKAGRINLAFARHYL